ncbi:MAG: MerR family transcriptional regulator [Marmoricola sp.]
MWVSELSERAEIPIDTVKHYLRIGVLHKGVPLAGRRAEYDESHIARLKLIRALTEVGDMKLDSVRRVFEAVDETQTTLRAAVGPAHYELSRGIVDGKTPSETALAIVDGVIARQGWEIDESSVHRLAMAISLDALEVIDDMILDGLLDVYAQAMDTVARSEIGYVDTSSRDRAIRSIVIGTVLYEPLITLLRRLAHEHVSRSWSAEVDWIAREE